MAQLTADAAARSPTVRRTLFWTLGLGAFGLAFSITTTAAYLPPLLRHFTDSGSLIGLILGAEGVFALALSPVIGPWSDTFHTPLGRRRPFMLAALGPLGFCLLLLPFMPNLWTTTLIVLAFFFAYYVYEPPYRGLYPDLLPEWTYGRAQGVQHVLRGIALGAALVGGGWLLKVWDAGPFVLAAFVTTAACGAAILFGREDGGHGHDVGVGVALQADAGPASRRRVGSRDHDEGARSPDRHADRGARDRPRPAVAERDRRLSGGLVRVRHSDPRRHAARLPADEGGAGQRQTGIDRRLRPKPQTFSPKT